MYTPVWRILLLMSMIGLTVTYQGISKLDQTTYAVSYRLKNGYLTTVHVTGGHMDIIDPKGNRVGYADIMEGLEISSGGQATLRIRVVLTEPLKALVGKHPTNARVTFRGYVTYDTGWLSWLFGSGKLEFEENAPLSVILEYLGTYGIND